MQPFLERIIGHLERVQRVAAREVVDAGVPLDFGRFEAFVLRLFEGYEDADLHWHWDPWYLRRFVEELHWDLLDGVGRHWSATEREQAIEAAIASHSGATRPLSAVASTRVDPQAPLTKAMATSVVRRIGDWSPNATGAGVPQPDEWQAAPRYCERLGLVSTSAAGANVTPGGRMLLQLRGRDRLRWLLALETCVASSGRDPWCMDLGSVRSLSMKRHWVLDPRADEYPPANWFAINRWTELGALRDTADELTVAAQCDEFEVTDVGAALFCELAADDGSSFRILVRALLEDEREHVLAPLMGDHRSRDRATAATLRHARMVAHEVRNALLPVQYALREVWADPLVSTTSIAEQRRTIEDGLARLHRFVDDSLRLTPIAAEEAEPFSVMAAIEEARRQCDPAPGGGMLVEARPGSADPHCRGHRGRFVLALLNVLRNAVQAGGPDVRIELVVDARTAGRVIITIRDDGPGISQAQQASIFENGVSYRDGGSGHGLSFVRVVVQEEMGGTIRIISPDDHGGACFQLELPTYEEK